MNTLPIIGASLTTLLLACTTQAAETGKYRSWYVGADILMQTAPDSDVKGSSTGSISYQNSIGLSDIKVGYRPQLLYTNAGSVRYELEILGRALDVHRVTNGATHTNPKGDLQVGALMANSYYDFHTNTAFTPYIGAGVGAAGIRFSKNPGLGITDKESVDAVLAGQLMTGVAYTPASLPQTSWSLGYNIMATDSPEFRTTTGRIKIDTPVVNAVQLGMKYHF